MVAAAVVGTVVAAGASAYSASQQKKAASRATDAQSAAAYAQMDQQQAQFDRIRELLQPWVNQGTNANAALGNLLGTNGNGAQQESISALQQSPLYTSQLQAGQNAILQNASATGGLRGGNAQAALGKYAPALLASTIQNQVQNLGGLSAQGLSAAGGTATGLQNLSNANSQALGNIGQAQAGNALAIGNANAQFGNSIGSIGGALAGNYFGGGGSNPFGGSGGGGFGYTGQGSLFGAPSTGGASGYGLSPVTGLNSGVNYPTGGGYF
jgi:hypothetical protein